MAFVELPIDGSFIDTIIFRPSEYVQMSVLKAPATDTEPRLTLDEGQIDITRRRIQQCNRRRNSLLRSREAENPNRLSAPQFIGKLKGVVHFIAAASEALAHRTLSTS